MMLLLTLALVAEAGAPFTVMPGVGQTPQRCIAGEKRVRGTTPGIGPRKLNEMPDAEAQLAVLRSVEGCPIPARVIRGTRER